MDASLQLAISMGVPTLAVLVGILINNSRLSDLRSHMDSGFANIDKRFDDMKETWRAELQRVEGVIDARLSHLEKNNARPGRLAATSGRYSPDDDSFSA